MPDAWPKFRNPVLYTDLESVPIDVETLPFHSMPVPAPTTVPQVAAADTGPRPLTMVEAKAGLALTFGVAPSDIEIIVRG